MLGLELYGACHCNFVSDLFLIEMMLFPFNKKTKKPQLFRTAVGPDLPSCDVAVDR
jgi:hypothetical protein